jgi:hypothetical protein
VRSALWRYDQILCLCAPWRFMGNDAWNFELLSKLLPCLSCDQCTFSQSVFDCSLANENSHMCLGHCRWQTKYFGMPSIQGQDISTSPKWGIMSTAMLHCLDTEQSNAIRKVYKERGENVGAWRQACYLPLVNMARANGWDIEGLFNRNERLRIWYVPTKLRQLCHAERIKYGE